jgi:hypothetical protein
MSRAIPLLPFWAFGAWYRVNFTLPITVLRTVLPHMTVARISKPEHLRRGIFQTFFPNKVTLRRSLAGFSYSLYTICNHVKASTIRPPPPPPHTFVYPNYFLDVFKDKHQKAPQNFHIHLYIQTESLNL